MSDNPAQADESPPEADAPLTTDVAEAPAPEAGAPPAAKAGVTAPTAPSAADTADVRPNRRKVREGLVLSIAMDKTAVVGVIDRVRHPRYAKTVQRTKRLYAHDENNDLRVGDRF